MLDATECWIRNTIEAIRKPMGSEELAVRRDANPLLSSVIDTIS